MFCDSPGVAKARYDTDGKLRLQGSQFSLDVASISYLPRRQKLVRLASKSRLRVVTYVDRLAACRESRAL